MHTGDVSHLSKPEEFDTAEQIIGTAGLETHYVPGEHDVLNDEGSGFFQRFAKESKTGGWYSFDQGGVHFVALVNVLNLKAGGLGYLGAAQSMARRRSERAQRQHAHRRPRPYAALDALSAMGLGNR